MINLDRLLRDINTMAEIGIDPDGGVTRPAFSDVEKAAREVLMDRMIGAGLDIRVDAAGNIIGRLDGEGPAVIAGSHIDSVAHGGNYDGVLGVFGAVECIRTIREQGVALRHPVEVVAFADEEERFYGFFGSYAFSGRIDYDDVKDAVDDSGIRLEDAMREFGLDLKSIGSARRPPEEIRAFLELHVEQGPFLDGDGVSIGVVDTVKGDFRYNISINGRTDHAGAPPSGRKDAFMVMHDMLARFLRYLEGRAKSDTSCTVGRMVVQPNIETIQPGLVEYSLDFRSSERADLESIETELSRIVVDCEREYQVEIVMSPILREFPLGFDTLIVKTIRDAAEKLGYRYRCIASGAGHDGQVIGRCVPAAMIFVPSVGGRSHCPQEFTHPEDIERGVNVLYQTIVSLAQ